MGFWIREVAGWLLVLAGLYCLYLCLGLLLNPYPRILEAGPVLVIGIVVFRGGIHLLKVAVAARICMRVERETRKPI